MKSTIGRNLKQAKIFVNIVKGGLTSFINTARGLKPVPQIVETNFPKVICGIFWQKIRRLSKCRYRKVIAHSSLAEF